MNNLCLFKYSPQRKGLTYIAINSTFFKLIFKMKKNGGLNIYNPLQI